MDTVCKSIIQIPRVPGEYNSSVVTHYIYSMKILRSNPNIRINPLAYSPSDNLPIGRSSRHCRICNLNNFGHHICWGITLDQKPYSYEDNFTSTQNSTVYIFDKTGITQKSDVSSVPCTVAYIGQDFFFTRNTAMMNWSPLTLT